MPNSIPCVNVTIQKGSDVVEIMYVDFTPKNFPVVGDSFQYRYNDRVSYPILKLQHVTPPTVEAVTLNGQYSA